MYSGIILCEVESVLVMLFVKIGILFLVEMLCGNLL